MDFQERIRYNESIQVSHLCETTYFRGIYADGKSFPRGEGFRMGDTLKANVRWIKVLQDTVIFEVVIIIFLQNL